MRGRFWHPYAFILPALLPMALIVGLPLLQTIALSFTNLRDRNFDLWTLGFDVRENAAPGAAGPIAVVSPGGPAARAGLPDGAEVRAVGTEATAGGQPRVVAKARRALAGAQRNFLQQNGPSAVVIHFQHAGAAGVAAVPFQRQPFDWNLKPERDATTWGFVGIRQYRDILVPGPENPPAELSVGFGEKKFAVKFPARFYSVLATTVAWTFLNVSLHYVLGLGLALLLNRNLRGTAVYRAILLLPWAVPVFVTAFSWRWIFNGPYGVGNALLRALATSRIPLLNHVGPVPWLSDWTWTFVAATVTNAWLGTPFTMVMLLAGLKTIPSDLYEAAAIDGCTTLQAFRHVTLPMLRPIPP